MGVFDSSLNLYRKTVKRIRPLHVAMHGLMTRVLIPVLERMQGFYTIPDDPFWFRLELLTKRHEKETTQQIVAHLKPGMTFLDIGAHVGYYSRMCADIVGKQGRVIAFEPHPRTFATLTRNTQHLPNVIRANLAVAEQEGTAELYDYLMMSASGSLHYDESLVEIQRSGLKESDIAPRIHNDFQAQKFTVRTTPIDAYLDEIGISQVDVVKMDIEGAEIGALRGMKATIARSPQIVLIMEYNPQALKAFGLNPEAALQEVLALGFKKVQIIHATGQLSDITGDDATIHNLTTRLMSHMDVVNVLFTKQ